MASSRVFVRGLPPTLSDADFKKHFGTVGAVTDSKLFAQRRIGYIGYQSPEQAEQAVKYFNKTFIRMSKLAVEIAQPVSEAPTSRRLHDRLTRDEAVSMYNLKPAQGEKDLKRKRGSEEVKPARSTKLTQPTPEYDSTRAAQKEPVVTTDISESHKAETRAGESKDVHTIEQNGEAEDTEMPDSGIPATDADWMRSRTSRVLDLAEDEDARPIRRGDPSDEVRAARPIEPIVEDGDGAAAMADEQDQTVDADEEQPAASTDPADEIRDQIRASGRLFLRNLAYQTTEDSLRQAFSAYETISEVHVPVDSKTRAAKGFAFVMFEDAEEAVKVWDELDRKTHEGRLLHILPAAAKRVSQMDDFDLSKLPLKKQQLIKRRREASTSSFNWNSLYMNPDAIMSSVADRLKISKADLLDPTSSDAAVKQAHAETHIIQETKSYFRSQGVNLDSFGKSKRGDTAILVKNFPFDARAEELKDLFEQHGKLKRFLISPTGTLAIAEYGSAPEARSAYSSLAYRKFKGSMLFLEKAPQDLFTKDAADIRAAPVTTAGRSKTNAEDLLQAEEPAQDAPTSTLFVRNLNFTTTTNRLDEVFRPLDGFMSARVKTKVHPKKPEEILSMGFGFLEFRSKVQAQNALAAMDGYNLDGHTLQIRASHKGNDAAEERRKEDASKKQAAKKAKLVIKNLPFEASKKEVRALLAPYGQLRSVRVPKKIGQSTRGFAFAEFTTPKEAENARDALRSTHLLGRRLVIDYAAEDPEDAEEELERMQSKVGSQLNKVAVQKLMGDGRKKFTVSDQGQEDI